MGRPAANVFRSACVSGWWALIGDAGLTRFRKARQKYGAGENEELVDQRQRIRNQHVEHEQRTTHSQHRSRTQSRDERREDPSDQKCHAL